MLRINIPLTTDEMRLLISNAERQCRAPKDQARFILRSVLLNESCAGNNKPASQLVSQDGQANGFGIGNPT